MLLLAPLRVLAETCSAIAAGTYTWDAVTKPLWTNCSESGDDTFFVPAGVTLEVRGTIAMSSGTIILAGGTLDQVGQDITFSGVTDGGVEVTDGTWRLQGMVSWTGRIASAVSYEDGPPETASFTIPVADISTIATSNDYVVILDDDADARIGQPIEQPVQVGSGPPIAGHYRPSYAAGKWHRIQATPASSTLTIFQNDYEDSEGLPGAGTDPYVGTRGPAVPVATATTGPPALVVTDNGMVTSIAVPETTARVDGDLMSQYVEWMEGPCSDLDGSGLGRNTHWKIVSVDDDYLGDGGTDDLIYLWGDATVCDPGGALQDIRVHYGLREGDRIAIVRPARVVGTNATDGPTVFWHGGAIQASYASFEYLDDANDRDMAQQCLAAGTPYACCAGLQAGATCGITTLTQYCLFCTFPGPGGTAPDDDDSFLEYVRMVYGQTSVMDTGGFSFLGHTPDETEFINGTGPLDMSGMIAAHVYAADQAFNDDGNGLHGFLGAGAISPDIRHYRAERLGDDGIAWLDNAFGDAADGQSLTLRNAVIGEIMSPTSNSQQCIDSSARDVTSTNEPLLHRRVLTDVMLNGCKDGPLANTILGAEVTRVVATGGSGSGSFGTGTVGSWIDADDCIAAANPEACCTGPGLGPTCIGIPTGSIAAKPSILRDSVLYSSGGSLNLRLSGNVYDSVIVGNGHDTTSDSIENMVLADGLFANMGTAAATLLRRTRGPGNRNPLFTANNSVFLTSSTTSGRTLAAHWADDGVLTALTLNRVYLGIDRAATNGFLSVDTITGTDTTQPVHINGLTLAQIRPQHASLGRGAANQGTAAGARIQNACVEATNALPATAAIHFGAAMTDTSMVVVDNDWPDANELHAIEDFVTTGDGSICEGLARPAYVGLRHFGTAHARMGDGAVIGIERFTTHDDLIRTITGQGECQDGLDNDGDGLVDHPADLECTTPSDPSELPDCSDGLDNDGDGLADLADPGCPAPEAAPENPPCDDGLDNDGDGFVDFDDPACNPAWPYWEAGPCGVGFELLTVLPFTLGLHRLSRRAARRWRRQMSLDADASKS